MKKLHAAFTSLCVLIAFILSGCHTSHPLTSATSYRSDKPQFIDNIYVGGNSNYINMNDVIKRHHKDFSKREAKEASTLQKKYADILKVLPQEITNYSLYKFIDDWYGVNYKLGGDDKSGIDCSAFAQTLYQQVFGINLVRTALEQFNLCNIVKNTKDLKEGDLIFFHIHSRHITHVGIYLTNNYFIHASSSRGVTIDNLNDDYWRHYYAGAGEVPNNM